MDNRGFWHKTDAETERRFTAEMLNRPTPGEDRPRFVVEVGIGEMVQVANADGKTLLARFEGAERNRVTLTPQDDGTPIPFTELASTVTVERSTGETFKAQVWDNRGGRMILRTLPVGTL